MKIETKQMKNISFVGKQVYAIIDDIKIDTEDKRDVSI